MKMPPITLAGLFATFLFGLVVRATPIILQGPHGVKHLHPSQISSFLPFARYSAAAYCRPSKTISWDCGANCDANCDFQPVASGGDGIDTPFWYVGYASEQRTVIVAHQGFDVRPFLSEPAVSQERLDPILFPGIPPSIKVHRRMVHEQAKTAEVILSSVKTALAEFHADSVTVVGHSAGGAVALLDAVFLSAQPSVDVAINAITFGMPRVGNQAFADFVDRRIRIVRVINKEDFIPTLPSLRSGYRHSSGEIRIQESGAWVSCPGQDSTSNQCVVGGSEGDPLKANFWDHFGPYSGVEILCHQ